jgi:Holliday junction resolvase RusA-like endonuclease
MIEVDPDPFGTAPAPVKDKRRKPAPVIEPPAGYTGPIEFVIYGEPASKANSREIVTMRIKGTDKTRPAVIKSEKAIDYEHNALRQIPPRARLQLQCPVAVTMRIFYASERPDLDESVVLDVMQNRYAKHKGTGARVLIQAGVYVNDRQVREKHVFHGIDSVNPRCEVRIESIARQGALL